MSERGKASAVARRLAELRKSVELTTRQMAELLDVPHSTYTSYEARYKKQYLPMELVRNLAPILISRGVEEEEIKKLAGVRTGDSLPAPTESSRVVGAKLQVIDNIVEFAGTSYAAVGVWDIQVSAGHGIIPYDGEPEAFNLFRVDFLRTVSRAPLGMLAAIRVSGDSMANTLHNGDHVLVDRTINRVGRDGIYVIRLGADDEIMVKRCARHPGSKTLQIKADNPEYPTYDGIRDEDIQVLGRVVWLGRNVGG
jgi:phage repressor protein C with HTH and peptisase S24 domain